MGGRTHFRVARTMPEACKGLGEIHRLSRGMARRRPYPPHNPATRKVLLYLTEFRARLLDKKSDTLDQEFLR